MNKKIVGISLVLLLLSTSIAFAQPMGREGAPGLKEKQMPPGLEKRPVPRPHIEPLVSAHGFALSGEEFHLLSISVLKTRALPPRDMLGMLRGNKSFEDILGKLEKDGKTVVTRGTLKFGTKHYGLNITSFDNKTLEAEIITLPQPRMPPIPTNESVKPEVVGHIKISVEPYEGARVATGEITIDSKNYKALLVVVPLRIPQPMGRGPPEGIEPPMRR